MLPSPPELFARFERGEIERDELQRLMAVHARELIHEIEDEHQNPAAAWWEGMMARRAMNRLVGRHGPRLVREVLIALSDADFPAARYLWNAEHPDVPLYCFLRIKKMPVFRILSLHENDRSCDVVFECDSVESDKPKKRRLTLIRGASWNLHLPVEKFPTTHPL